MINTRENFMNKLWCSSGKTIKTNIGDGIIVEMRTTVGIDISVDVFMVDTDCKEMMSGLKLWEEGATIG